MTGASAAYEISDDPVRLDLDAVCAFLSKEAYWGRWRSRTASAPRLWTGR